MNALSQSIQTTTKTHLTKKKLSIPSKNVKILCLLNVTVTNRNNNCLIGGNVFFSHNVIKWGYFFL